MFLSGYLCVSSDFIWRKNLVIVEKFGTERQLTRMVDFGILDSLAFCLQNKEKLFF